MSIWVKYYVHSSVFNDVVYLHGIDMSLGVALAVARLHAPHSVRLHVHALASACKGIGKVVKLSLHGDELDGEGVACAVHLIAYIHVCKGGIPKYILLWHSLFECSVKRWVEDAYCLKFRQELRPLVFIGQSEGEGGVMDAPVASASLGVDAGNCHLNLG